MKLVRKLDAIFERAITIPVLLAATLLIFLMLIVSTEVTMRLFVKRSIWWMPEVTEISLLYITFLTTAWVLKKERHVKMDIVLSRLSSRARAVMNIITSIIAAVCCLVVTWYGVVVTWEYFQGGHYIWGVLRTPTFLVLAIIPMGTFLLFVQFLRRTNGYLRIWRNEDLRTKVAAGSHKLKV